MKDIIQSIDEHIIQWSLTVGLLFILVIVRSIVLRMVKKHGIKNEVDKSRSVYIKKLVNVTLVVLFATLIGSVWEISVKGLSVYFASIFTVVGVALFATWSVLSNMTASLVLFFFFPYRIGDKIKIMDGDNSVEGEISDISLFYVEIKGENNRIYTYPNNLAIQKAISRL
ncbi:MAG: mechanosensitive ion channel family protein [Bacteroidota bacterium]